MKITFEYDYLKELYEDGKCSDKKHRYQPQIVKAYQKRIQTLISVKVPEQLYQFNSLNFEALQGDKAGRFSIRVNDKYRIEFTLRNETEDVWLTICNIIELSNHYK